MGNAYDYAFYLERPDVVKYLEKHKKEINENIKKIVSRYNRVWY